MAENENAIGAAEATPAEAHTGGSGTNANAEPPDTAAANAEPPDTTTANAEPPDTAAEAEAAPASTEEITYHAVEKDGQVTALWEMQGRKHLRTIDPRSRQGQEILRLYTAEHHDEQ